jgi:hypothetical protein
MSAARPADAYAALRSNNKAFVKAFSENRRLNLPEAVSNLRALIKAQPRHRIFLSASA